MHLQQIPFEPVTILRIHYEHHWVNGSVLLLYKL
jgi:hypothetical protein